MSLRSQEPGRLTLVDASIWANSLWQFIDQLKRSIDELPNKNAITVLVEADQLEGLLRAFDKGLGKRRYMNLNVTTPWHLLAQLKGHTVKPGPGVLQQLVEALAASSCEVSDLLDSGLSLDELVVSDPEAPISKAYLHGLDSLGLSHPYLDIWNVSLPVSVSTVFVFSLHLFPPSLQHWLLSHIPKGVSIVASHLDVSTLIASLPSDTSVQTLPPRTTAARGVKQSSRVFATPLEEHTAIISACENGSIDAVFCIDRSRQREIELDCILNQIPYRSPSLRSITSTSTINALVAYLEWLLHEEETALETLLSLIGASADAWPEYARRRELPRKLSVGSLLVDDRDPATDPLTLALPKLASLILKSRVEPTPVGRLLYFATWGEQNLTNFDSGLIDVLIERGGIDAEQVTLDQLRQLLYQALSNHQDDCVSIAGPNDPYLSSSKRAWLAIGDLSEDQAARWCATILPHLKGQLTISTVQAG